MASSIHPEELVKILKDGREYALLDVRERGAYARGHLFLAINLPLSRLELCIRQFVPRQSTRTVLCDDDDGFAARAAWVIEAAGYSDVSIIAGGVSNCTGAGFELFRGHYAAPYTFGLHVDQHCRPPSISPQRLAVELGTDRPPLVVDSRTREEFREASIPGAINVPLGELPYRIRDVVPDCDTPVVVSCGAVTRGVLGGQSLIEAGIGNPVSVLAGGLRGWEHAGYASEAGTAYIVPPVSAAASAQALNSAARLAEAAGVRCATSAELDVWRGNADHTLFVVDIRTREEYVNGHLHDAVWIPGGELIGLYEDHIATMNSRICLVDDDGARALFVATWLRRMGWPGVAVLQGGTQGHALVTGFRFDHIPGTDPVGMVSVGHQDLWRQLESDSVLVLDFAESSAYEEGHIPGAWWASRSHLPDLVGKLPASERLVTTCPDGRLATLAAAELAGLSAVPVAVLRGGTQAWRASGRKLVTGLTRTLGATDDAPAEFVIRRGDDPLTVRSARRRMLEWQGELLDILERDRTFNFPDPGSKNVV